MVEQGLEDIPASYLRKKKRKARPEDVLQIACINLLRSLGPKVRFIVAQPDRIKAPTMFMRGKLKALGVFGNKGHAEIIVLDSRRRPRVVFIELKDDKGVASAEQKNWQEWCVAAGWESYVVKSVDRLAEILRA